MSTIYNKDSPEYKGTALDNNGRRVDGFIIDENVHVVYNLGEPNQFSSYKSLHEIRQSPDLFLWAPYIYFCDKP
jgi:hypothetical protein